MKQEQPKTRATPRRADGIAQTRLHEPGVSIECATCLILIPTLLLKDSGWSGRLGLQNGGFQESRVLLQRVCHAKCPESEQQPYRINITSLETDSDLRYYKRTKSIRLPFRVGSTPCAISSSCWGMGASYEEGASA